MDNYAFKERMLDLALQESDLCCVLPNPKNSVDRVLISMFKEEYNIPQEQLIEDSALFKEHFGDAVLWSIGKDSAGRVLGKSIENKKARKIRNDYFKTKRKTEIARRNGWNVDEPNRFNKGKIHCSCHMCRSQSHTESRQWLRANDIMKENKKLTDFENYDNIFIDKKGSE